MMAHQIGVVISGELFSEICRTGWKIPSDDTVSIRCIQGVPPDAKRIRSFYDSENDKFILIFEHQSFQDIEQGNRIPEIKVVFQRENKRA